MVECWNWKVARPHRGYYSSEAPSRYYSFGPSLQAKKKKERKMGQIVTLVSDLGCGG